jgi:hypothetical protein
MITRCIVKMKEISALQLRVFLVLLLIPGLVVPLRADTWDVGAGYSYESGDFGTGEDVDVSIFTVLLDYYGDVWGASLELPYVSVTGSETIVPSTSGQGASGNGFGYGNNNTGSTTTSSGSESVTREGIGDIGLSISRAFFPETENGAFHEAIFSIKLPTASESENLGSGEADYSLELATSLQRGAWSPLFALGYQLTGDPPDVDLNDVWFYSLGIRYDIGDSSRIGLIYDFRQALVDDEPDGESLSVSLNTRPTADLSFNLELTAGLTDANADSAVAVSVSTRF